MNIFVLKSKDPKRGHLDQNLFPLWHRSRLTSCILSKGHPSTDELESKRKKHTLRSHRNNLNAGPPCFPLETLPFPPESIHAEIWTPQRKSYKRVDLAHLPSHGKRDDKSRPPQMSRTRTARHPFYETRARTPSESAGRVSVHSAHRNPAAISSLSRKHLPEAEVAYLAGPQSRAPEVETHFRRTPARTTQTSATQANGRGSWLWDSRNRDSVKHSRHAALLSSIVHQGHFRWPRGRGKLEWCRRGESCKLC